MIEVPNPAASVATVPMVAPSTTTLSVAFGVAALTSASTPATPSTMSGFSAPLASGSATRSQLFSAILNAAPPPPPPPPPTPPLASALGAMAIGARAVSPTATHAFVDLIMDNSRLRFDDGDHGQGQDCLAPERNWRNAVRSSRAANMRDPTASVRRTTALRPSIQRVAVAQRLVAGLSLGCRPRVASTREQPSPVVPMRRHDHCRLHAVGVSALRWRTRWGCDLEELLERLAGGPLALADARAELTDVVRGPPNQVVPQRWSCRAAAARRGSSPARTRSPDQGAERCSRPFCKLGGAQFSTPCERTPSW